MDDNPWAVDDKVKGSTDQVDPPHTGGDKLIKQDVVEENTQHDLVDTTIDSQLHTVQSDILNIDQPIEINTQDIDTEDQSKSDTILAGGDIINGVHSQSENEDQHQTVKVDDIDNHSIDQLRNIENIKIPDIEAENIEQDKRIAQEEEAAQDYDDDDDFGDFAEETEGNEIDQTETDNIHTKEEPQIPITPSIPQSDAPLQSRTPQEIKADLLNNTTDIILTHFDPADEIRQLDSIPELNDKSTVIQKLWSERLASLTPLKIKENNYRRVKFESSAVRAECRRIVAEWYKLNKLFDSKTFNWDDPTFGDNKRNSLPISPLRSKMARTSLDMPVSLTTVNGQEDDDEWGDEFQS